MIDNKPTCNIIRDGKKGFSTGVAITNLLCNIACCVIVVILMMIERKKHGLKHWLTISLAILVGLCVLSVIWDIVELALYRKGYENNCSFA